jgi:hypothetical protein
MELAPFALRDPISLFDENVAEFIQQQINQHCESVSWRTLFGIPISALVPKGFLDQIDLDHQRRRLINRGWWGEKVAILLVNYEDSRPVAAIIHETQINHESIRMLLQQNEFPVYRINEENYKGQLASLFHRSNSNNKIKQKIGEPLNLIEKGMDLALRGWIQPLKEDFQIMPQVGLSEVISLSDSNLQEIMQREYRSIYRDYSINSAEDFEHWNGRPFGREIQDLKLIDFGQKTSLDFVVLEKITPGTHRSYVDDGMPGPKWWPSLAIEIDGPDHEKPHMIFNDFLKNELCRRAMLPLLRIKLSSAGSFYHHVRAEIGLADPDISRPDVDFVRFMVARKYQGYFSFQKKKKSRERWTVIGMRAKKLLQDGLSSQDALDTAWDEDIEFHRDTDDEERFFELSEKAEYERIEREYLEKKYYEKYQCQPNVQVTVNENGELSGRLGKVSLPTLKAFCTEVDEIEMTELQLEFGRFWLYKTALGDSYW